MIERSGRCLCGQASYRLTGEPVRVRTCWCRSCQRIAANGTVNMAVQASVLVIEGDLCEYGSVADSGHHVIRRFCPVCGTHLFVNSSGFAELTVVGSQAITYLSAQAPSVSFSHWQHLRSKSDSKNHAGMNAQKS